MKPKLLFLLATFLFAGISANAQNTIIGKVTDDTNTPLPGVNIVVKGTQNGTITDTGGNFRITAGSPDVVLIFSSLGFETQEVRAGTSPLNVVMSSEDEALGEVVLVGSRNPNRSKTTTPVAVDVIGIQQIKNTLPQTTLNDMLNYLVPSLTTTASRLRTVPSISTLLRYGASGRIRYSF